MDQKDLTIQKLKRIIYNQKMALYRHEIPSYNCPWHYGYVENNEEIDCNDKGCSKCCEEFWEALSIQIKKEVEELE